MQLLWKTARRFPPTLNIELPYEPAIPLVGIYTKELKTESICTLMFTATFFILAKREKELKWSSADKCISKMWYTHKMDYYSILKRNGILRYATTWINIEDIMCWVKYARHKRTNTV